MIGELRDIFICHASEDKEKVAKPMIEAFTEAGISFWYDEAEIKWGDSITQKVNEGLSMSRYVIVVFSLVFIKKNWPQKELNAVLNMEASSGQVKVLPLLVGSDHEQTEILQKYPLLNDKRYLPWDSDLKKLVGELLNRLGRAISSDFSAMAPVLSGASTTTKEKKIARTTSMPIGGSSLTLPCFFPSVSSVKTQLPPFEYLQVLKAFDHPQVLVSAYDIYNCSERERKKIEALVASLFDSNVSILLDSGHYERFWKEDRHLRIDRRTKWSKKKYWSVLQSTKFHISFSYDKHATEQDIKTEINNVENGVISDQKKSTQATIVPIIHGDSKTLPGVVAGVAKRLNPPLLAVPERELGDGIIGRAKTVATIRDALNRTGQYYPLHLLGTGNPLSILIYVISGADSFDGLEWCQTTVNHENSLLYHFQQRELLGAQSQFCTMTGISYAHSTLGHNLLFYRNWMKKIQSAVVDDSLQLLLGQFASAEICDMLKKNLPGALA